MKVAQAIRWITSSDAGARLATLVLYGLVFIGGAATLINLKSFRDDTLAEAHQQVSGLAATLAQHVTAPLDTASEIRRLAPLSAGLGSTTVIAVVDRNRDLLLSLPAARSAGRLAEVAAERVASAPSGTFSARWPDDGIERIWGVAANEDRQLMVLIGVSQAQVTAPVVQLAWHMTALVAALALGALLLAHFMQLLQARRRVEAALQASNRAAVVAADAKASFLANMSHELRTPMTGVLGMADLLMGTRLDDEQARMLSTMRASARTLLTVLNDVLDFSKVEAGKIVLETIDFDLREVVKDAVRLLTPSAAEKGLTLTTVIGPACPRWVKGDPSRLQQVLFNLIGNAVKFTESGGVTIRLQPEGEATSFAVEDTGIGMNAEELGRLFTPFTQADASTTRRFGGTGLGLAIAKRLVALMGGNIVAASAPGKGSTFSFTLLLPPGTEAAPGSETVDRPPRPLSVLVAEDNSVNQELIARMLARMGHTVTLAEHGVEALEKASLGDFDIVLMDMQMPLMDGETATRLIRALPGGRGRVPVVALTADAVLEHRERYVAAGLDAFLTKPVSWKLLARTLDELGNHDRPAPAATASSPPTGAPALSLPVADAAYLEDMRQWVGDEALLNLLASAPDSFRGEFNGIRAAWVAGDITAVRETAHRLKGAAGSVGCRRLAETAHALQKAGPADLSAHDRLGALEADVAEALAALARWRPTGAAVPSQEQDTPVPPSPQ